MTDLSSDSSSAAGQPRGEIQGTLDRIGKYVIEKKLGVGGMGTVYLATDSELRRTVALKVLPRDRAENPTLVRRFKSEGQAAALLQHKNIVSVYEAGQADGHLFLALEYVEGIDLLEWMRKKGIVPIKRSVEIVRQVAEALQHACERNIVHRDIKPSNLMIATDGTVKLTDMGLARSIDDTLDTTITRDGTTVGTVDYMAPEQASNSKSADIRSDIYSLGCTWYHMLTGSAPYPRGSVTNKLAAHISAPLPDPRMINPNIPEAVVAVIHRMMAKKKEGRYQTPAELLEDLNSETLTHAGESIDLLAMFGEEEPIDGGMSSSNRGPQADASDSTSFVIGKPADRKAPERQKSPRKKLAESGKQKQVAAPTQAELPTPVPNRPAPLRRGQHTPGPDEEQGPVVPWQFFLLIGLVLFAGLVVWVAVRLIPFEDSDDSSTPVLKDDLPATMQIDEGAPEEPPL